jgi:thiamine kinase-like enzyme
MKTSKCKYCQGDIIFVTTEKGKLMPIDYEKQFINDVHYDRSVHTAHFATCKNYKKKK